MSTTFGAPFGACGPLGHSGAGTVAALGLHLYFAATGWFEPVQIGNEVKAGEALPSWVRFDFSLFPRELFRVIKTNYRGALLSAHPQLNKASMCPGTPSLKESAYRYRQGASSDTSRGCPLVCKVEKLDMKRNTPNNTAECCKGLLSKNYLEERKLSGCSYNISRHNADNTRHYRHILIGQPGSSLSSSEA